MIFFIRFLIVSSEGVYSKNTDNNKQLDKSESLSIVSSVSKVLDDKLINNLNQPIQIHPEKFEQKEDNILNTSNEKNTKKNKDDKVMNKFLKSQTSFNDPHVVTMPEAPGQMNLEHQPKSFMMEDPDAAAKAKLSAFTVCSVTYLLPTSATTPATTAAPGALLLLQKVGTDDCTAENDYMACIAKDDCGFCDWADEATKLAAKEAYDGASSTCTDKPVFCAASRYSMNLMIFFMVLG